MTHTATRTLSTADPVEIGLSHTDAPLRIPSTGNAIITGPVGAGSLHLGELLETVYRSRDNVNVARIAANHGTGRSYRVRISGDDDYGTISEGELLENLQDMHKDIVSGALPAQLDGEPVVVIMCNMRLEREQIRKAVLAVLSVARTANVHIVLQGTSWAGCFHEVAELCDTLITMDPGSDMVSGRYVGGRYVDPADALAAAELVRCVADEPPFPTGPGSFLMQYRETITVGRAHLLP